MHVRALITISATALLAFDFVASGLRIDSCVVANLSDFFEFLFRLGLVGRMLIRMPLDGTFAVSLDAQCTNSKQQAKGAQISTWGAGCGARRIFRSRKGLEARRCLTFLI